MFSSLTKGIRIKTKWSSFSTYVKVKENFLTSEEWIVPATRNYVNKKRFITLLSFTFIMVTTKEKTLRFIRDLSSTL